MLPSPLLFVRDAARVFDPEGQLTDVATRERLAKFLVAFAAWVDLLTPHGESG